MIKEIDTCRPINLICLPRDTFQQLVAELLQVSEKGNSK